MYPFPAESLPTGCELVLSFTLSGMVIGFVHHFLRIFSIMVEQSKPRTTVKTLFLYYIQQLCDFEYQERGQINFSIFSHGPHEGFLIPAS